MRGALDDFGDAFPNFLGTLKELSSLPYIKDYASYEWLKHQAYGAADAQAISSSELLNISEEQLDYVRFSFIPSCTLFSSTFPIPDIQEVIENCEAEPINLSNTPAYGLIARLHNEVFTFWISKDLWTFINCLAEGLTLLQSNEHTQSQYLAFDLTGALSFILQKQLVYKLI